MVFLCSAAIRDCCPQHGTNLRSISSGERQTPPARHQCHPEASQHGPLLLRPPRGQQLLQQLAERGAELRLPVAMQRQQGQDCLQLCSDLRQQGSPLRSCQLAGSRLGGSGGAGGGCIAGCRLQAMCYGMQCLYDARHYSLGVLHRMNTRWRDNSGGSMHTSGLFSSTAYQNGIAN